MALLGREHITVNVERGDQCPVERLKPGRIEPADKCRQARLRQADQFTVSERLSLRRAAFSTPASTSSESVSDVFRLIFQSYYQPPTPVRASMHDAPRA